MAAGGPEPALAGAGRTLPRAPNRPLVAPRPSTGTGGGRHVPSAARRAAPNSYEIPLFRRGGKKGVRKKKEKDTSHAPSANPGGHKASVYPSLTGLEGSGRRRKKTPNKQNKIPKKHNLRESKSPPRCPEPPRCDRRVPSERGGCAEPGAAAAAPGTGRSPRGPARPGGSGGNFSASRKPLVQPEAGAAGQRPPPGGTAGERGVRSAGVRGGGGGGGRESGCPGGIFRPFRGDGAGSVCGRTGHPSRGATGSAAPPQPHFVSQLRGARRETRGARIHLPRAQDARPPRWERAEGKHQKTERVWSFVKKQTKQNAELKK